MRCPTLNELPPSPPGKIGFPWTEESVQLPQKKSDGKEYPKISIVTPSYNQAQFIEETIRSVLLQGYPNLEYIIIDGGSTDNSTEIIRKYESYLTYWISEQDEGQSDAINKGFKISTGEISAFLNSDDVYMPNALALVSQYLNQNAQYDFICAQTRFIDTNSKRIKGFEELFMVEINDRTMTETCHIAQPSTFFRSITFDRIGFFSKELHYAFDYEYWLRAFLAGFKFISIKEVISLFRLHQNSKTSTDYDTGKFTEDFIKIYRNALLDRGLSPIHRKGLYRGLGNTACLLFVNLESTSSIREARNSFWNVIRQNLKILFFLFVWKTLILSVTPVPIRTLRRRFINK
jgi:glycosyltransferase involved in cell wall biosynthesis